MSATVTTSAPVPMEISGRGGSVYFSGGRYKGLKGWYDTKKGQTDKYVYVHVQKSDGTIKETRVKKTSIGGKRRGKAKTYVDAMLQQHPDIDALMDKLAREVSRCMVDSDAPRLYEVFQEKVRAAGAAQASMGHKATYRFVHFGEDKNIVSS